VPKEATDDYPHYQKFDLLSYYYRTTHNPEVVGSNPAPATNNFREAPMRIGAFLFFVTSPTPFGRPPWLRGINYRSLRSLLILFDYFS
jgi:hypothetical protein